jgi:hypothetical protein
MSGLKSGPISEATATAKYRGLSTPLRSGRDDVFCGGFGENRQRQSDSNGKSKRGRGESLRSPTIARSGGLRMGHPSVWGCVEENGKRQKQIPAG